MPKKTRRYWFETEVVPGLFMPNHKFYIVIEAGTLDAAATMAANIGMKLNLMLTLVE